MLFCFSFVGFWCAFKQRWRWVAVVGWDRAAAESGAAGVEGGAEAGGATATEAELEAAAGLAAEAGWVLAGKPRRPSCWSTGWTAETAARCWPEISARRSPSPTQSSSRTAPWSAPLRPPPLRALHTSDGFSPGPEREQRETWSGN